MMVDVNQSNKVFRTQMLFSEFSRPTDNSVAHQLISL